MSAEDCKPAEKRPHGSKRAIHTQLIYGIQSLFQSLNIEVQDVSPDVATRHGTGQYLTVAIRDKPYVKITVTLSRLHIFI